MKPATSDASSSVEPRPTGRHLLPPDSWQAIFHALKLSYRELQIVQGVFDDQKELAIARDLRISPNTVHTHMERLYRKLEVTSRVELVVRIFTEYLAIASEKSDLEAN